MARKALLIGSATGGLTGVDNDIASMVRALDRWGFTSVQCTAESASRAGILAAYERLIAESGPEDAVVVYYSGHGGYARAPEGAAVAPNRRTIQFIVPTDFSSSAEDDFRGITAVELSLLLARLTERTKNATVILDCCHSGHMSRDPDLTVKALSRAVSYRLIAAHLDNLRRRGQRLELWTPPGNPNAVRVVACAPEQFAYEYTNRAGLRTGMLTDALTHALAEAHAGGTAVSWATVIDRVRQRVLATAPSQRPEAEGPARRLLFDVTDTDPVATLPVSKVGKLVRISGAALFGVRPGDEFVVLPADGVVGRADQKIGDVRVDRVDSEAAWGELRPAGPVPVGARAHLVRTVAPALPVRVVGPPLAHLTRAIDSSALVRLADPDEESPVKVEIDAGGVTVRDEFGPLHAPRRADPAGIGTVLRDLTRVSRAQALRRLAERPEEALPTPVSVEFGQVENGRARQLPTTGAVLYTDDPVYLRVRNEGRDPVYVSLLDIGVTAQISLLNPSSPGGVRLAGGEGYVFGGNDLTGSVPGVPLTWPRDLPRDQPRPETIVVLATSTPVDTRVLEQQGVRTAHGGSGLQGYLDQLGVGGPRDLSPTLGPTVRFAVRTVDFELVPETAPPAEVTRFQVDERPDAATRLWSPKSAAPTDVAVRLTEVVVHHNRTFRCPNIRLDTVVITERCHHAHTERFAGVSDGERLPLDDMLIYRGPVTNYLDLAVWVSSGEGANLSDLLKDISVPAVSAIAVGAFIVDSADRLMSDVCGEHVGLYRTTLLPHEQFGIGRPMTVRAQDFSFRYLVEDVAPGPSVEVEEPNSVKGHLR